MSHFYIRGRVQSMPSLTGYESLSPADLLKRSIALAPRSRGPTFIKQDTPEVVPIVPKPKSEPKAPKVVKPKTEAKVPKAVKAPKPKTEAKVPKAVKAPKNPKILKTSAQLQRQAAGYILAAANASIREGK